MLHILPILKADKEVGEKIGKGKSELVKDFLYMQNNLEET